MNIVQPNINDHLLPINIHYLSLQDRSELEDCLI